MIRQTIKISFLLTLIFLLFCPLVAKAHPAQFYAGVSFGYPSYAYSSYGYTSSYYYRPSYVALRVPENINTRPSDIKTLQYLINLGEMKKAQWLEAKNEPQGFIPAPIPPEPNGPLQILNVPEIKVEKREVSLR